MGKDLSADLKHMLISIEKLFEMYFKYTIELNPINLMKNLEHIQESLREEDFSEEIQSMLDRIQSLVLGISKSTFCRTYDSSFFVERYFAYAFQLDYFQTFLEEPLKGFRLQELKKDILELRYEIVTLQYSSFGISETNLSLSYYNRLLLTFTSESLRMAVDDILDELLDYKIIVE